MVGSGPGNSRGGLDLLVGACLPVLAADRRPQTAAHSRNWPAMNTRIALRWLPRPVASSLHPHSIPHPTSILVQQIRHRSWFGLGGSSKDEPKAADVTASAVDNPPSEVIPTIERGDLASNTLFEDESIPGALPSINPLIRDPERGKWTWPKRADAREHRRRGRLTKKEHIMQTEKAHTAKSHFFKTSLKKLGPIARQIAGKSIDEAIVQMRFSVKKAARDVLGHLNQAKNEAILKRSMDPKVTYIEQAWVGRGEYQTKMSHRAKGRIDQLRLPYTSSLTPDSPLAVELTAACCMLIESFFLSRHHARPERRGH